MKQSKLILKTVGVAFGFLFVFGLLGAWLSGPLKTVVRSKDAIAVVEVKGEIVGGGSGSSLFGDAVAGAETMMRQIRLAAKDKNVKALLLHINSPGGSAPASEEVYMEVLRFKEETGKPVLAVLADVAASGGYFIAAGADEIYANPATMTGSIGVIMQFRNYQNLYEKYGVSVVTIKSGKYKDIGNPGREMQAEERKLLQVMVDQIYERFVQAVMQGRDLPREEVLKLAQGQIYTGVQAQELKLVDHLGNFYDAVEYLAEQVGIKGEPTLVYYRQKPSFLQRLLGGLMGGTVTSGGEMQNSFAIVEVLLLEETMKKPVGQLSLNY